MYQLNKEKNKSSRILKNIEYFEEIESTHTYIKNIADSDLKKRELTVIAERQTKGIGTKGRVWHTGIKKNIAVSILLRPECNLQKMNGLTVMIADCMKNVIQELYDIKLEIKYPNDLMLNNKKIGGILTEINTMGEKINYLIISIGFNVNEENFSKEIREIATSLKKEYNDIEFSRDEIIMNFLEELENQLEVMKIIDSRKSRTIS